MFQPWRAFTIVNNLCLTGKTSGFERPRAPVLQILWGIVNRAHIDYAERMWEEFTQSIHTFIEDKKNLAQHNQGKKKATLIVIPSVSANGTKQEVFGMLIPNNLITADIQGEQYYNAYLEKVAKHQRYLAGEEVSDPDSPAPKPTKATKPKATKQSKPLAPKAAPVIKPAAAKAPKPTASQPPKPTPAPTEPSKKDQNKKRKLLVDEFLDEGVPVNEPRFGDEEPDMQKAVEESLKDVHTVHQAPLLPVVIRKLESGKFQPLPETLMKKSHADQFIFQRRTPAPTEPSGHEESSSLYAELGLTNSKTESDEDVSPEINPAAKMKGPPPKPGWTQTWDLDPILFKEHRPLPAIATATATTTSITTLPLPPQPQQSTTDSILIKRIGELEQHMADLVQANLALEERMDKHGSRLYKLENLDIPHQVSKAVDEIVTDAVDWAIQAPLRDRFSDLPEADMKEILHHRMWETNSYKAHEDHKKLYEALEKSMDRDHSDQLLTDLAEARRKKKKRHDSPKTPPGSPPHQPPPPPPPAGPSGTLGASKTSGSSQLPPPPPPPSTNQSDQSKSTAAPSSSKTAALAEYTAWTTTDTRLKPSVSSIPEDLHMDADSAPDEQVHSSDDEDIGNDHIPKVNLKQDWWKPLPEEDRPATPEPAWSIPSSDLPVPMNN
ncbi:hypothetical protein Tco_0641059 [Tanacetum coccineum]